MDLKLYELHVNCSWLYNEFSFTSTWFYATYMTCWPTWKLLYLIVSVCLCMSVFVCVRMCMFLYVCICMSVSMCALIVCSVCSVCVLVCSRGCLSVFCQLYPLNSKLGTIASTDGNVIWNRLNQVMHLLPQSNLFIIELRMNYVCHNLIHL